MNSNLDVWAIQTLPEELVAALDNIKTDNDIILYLNLLCNFQIGGVNIKSRQFDTLLSSEENDILVMLMRGGKASVDDIRKYLDQKEFRYSEVMFAPSISSHYDDGSVPELWIAREKYVLEDAFEDSIKRDCAKKCEYYPFLTGSLDFCYFTNSASEKCRVDGRLFRGVIKLEDKLILLVNQNDERNVTARDVYEVIKRYDIPFVILENSEFSMENITNPKVRRL